MVDFKKIEVGKLFPGPVPVHEGVQMELWHDKLVMLIQKPGLSRDQLQAFNKGFNQYSYLESDTPVPITLWIFDFPAPHRFVEGSFNAKLAKREWVNLYLDTSENNALKKTIQFFLLDGQMLRATMLVELDPAAVELFHGTIQKQLNMDYNLADFDRYLVGLHNYEVKDLFSMGKVFKPVLRSGSLTSKLFLSLSKWFWN